jgi:hypothetical protein
VTKSALLKEWRWSEADFDIATTYPNFPKPKGRTPGRFKLLTGGSDVGEPTYRVAVRGARGSDRRRL